MKLMTILACFPVFRFCFENISLNRNQGFIGISFYTFFLVNKSKKIKLRNIYVNFYVKFDILTLS